MTRWRAVFDVVSAPEARTKNDANDGDAIFEITAHFFDLSEVFAHDAFHGPFRDIDSIDGNELSLVPTVAFFAEFVAHVGSLAGAHSEAAYRYTASAGSSRRGHKLSLHVLVLLSAEQTPQQDSLVGCLTRTSLALPAEPRRQRLTRYSRLKGAATGMVEAERAAIASASDCLH